MLGVKILDYFVAVKRAFPLHTAKPLKYDHGGTVVWSLVLHIDVDLVTINTLCLQIATH